MEKMIIANLKMNLSKKEIEEYKEIIENSDVDNLIIAPSNIYLSLLNSDKYDICAQNGYHIDNGAYTGEVSFYQLKNMGVKYSLIGHSERRHIFNETNKDIALKINSCIANGINPILCVGETIKEKNEGNTLKVITEQIESALSDNLFTQLIIAYEPVWAIGSGLIPTLNDINEVHLHIKELSNKYSGNVKVLYGGSVKLSNIKDICSLDSVDGVLIGSASNDANNLISMYKEVK